MQAVTMHGVCLKVATLDIAIDSKNGTTRMSF